MMVTKIRHKLWGGVEIVDAETGRVLAEAETAEDAGAVVAALNEKEEKKQPGLLDLLFGG